MNLIGIEKGKYDLEGNLHFLPIECSFSPNTGLSYCSKLHGCNTTPCHPKPKTTIGLCFVCSKVDVVLVCRLTNKFISH